MIDIGKPRIVYIVADRASAGFPEETLQSRGYIIDVFDDADKALKEHALVPYDFLAIDEYCQVDGCIKICKNLVLEDPGLPILIHYASGGGAIAAEALSLGLADIISNADPKSYEVLLPAKINNMLMRVPSVGRNSKAVGDWTELAIALAQEQAADSKDILDKSEKMYRFAADIAGLNYWGWDDINDKLAYCSEGYAHVHDMTVKELISELSNREADIDRVHPEDRAYVEDAYYRDRDWNTKPWKLEYRVINRNGEIRYLQEYIKQILDDDGGLLLTFGTMRDVTEQRLVEVKLRENQEQLSIQIAELQDRETRLESQAIELVEIADELAATKEQMVFLANHDALTNLPSLRLGRELLNKAVSKAKRDKENCALMFLDLDGFKQVNDTLGHEAGDEVLRQVSSRFKECVREADSVARIGGDEFIMILPSVEGKEGAAKIARRAIKELARPFEIIGECNSVSIGVSIGIALYPEHGDNEEALLKNADDSMYEIKRSGKNNFGFAPC